MRKAQNTETWQGDITALILHRIRLLKFDEIEGKIKDTHEKTPGYITSTVLWVPFLVQFSSLSIFNISRDLKWVKMSFTLTHKRSCKTCHRSYIFEEPGTKTRFCCSIKHKLHSTNPELSPSTGTLLFLSPNMQAVLGRVLCTSVIHSPGKKKKPQGRKVHLTIEQQREGTGWEMLVSDIGKWEAKREVLCKVLWVPGSGQTKLCKTKKQEETCGLYMSMYWERKQMTAKDTNICQTEQCELHG